MAAKGINVLIWDQKEQLPTYREEKSLRHVAMVAKFFGLQKSENVPKKWIRTVLNFIDLFNFI